MVPILNCLDSLLVSIDGGVTSTQLGKNQETAFTRRVEGTCLKNLTERIKKKIFILQWITTYSGHDFFGDLLAGLTIGLTIIPQSMALASIVGVPAEVYWNDNSVIFIHLFF